MAPEGFLSRQPTFFNFQQQNDRAGIVFVGYADTRELSDRDRLEKQDRQFFVKLSYAFQR